MTTIAGATEWLKALGGQIRYHPPDSVNRIEFNEKLRNLTKEEWETIKEIVREHSLPCSLWPGAYGFSLVVYEHKDSPTPDKKPEILLIVEDTQFPFPSAQKGFAGQKETLRKIAAITHSRQNKQILEHYGFAPLYPPSYYTCQDLPSSNF